ncbi:hypothetical protein BU24DRAFT_424385 [Aaosphaeria arxii CBS 175.79]|uniref:Uncharacterized protein n=1 Tax=Aaosphaeria arxii CBS 175.79 TaxID=1450172 RepID=A0A6A5XJS7_9PLEO|nr:uncharacterized protein BU24DRAFT_424385 [Aaosphaeria arxii CBS 175.79]KAF2013382.1 hypothetical protein BU24DRAFT_424385 [Aaosphaeria arxii CBS 175.79]
MIHEPDSLIDLLSNDAHSTHSCLYDPMLSSNNPPTSRHTHTHLKRTTNAQA